MRRFAAIDTGSTRNSCALAVVGQNRAGLWLPLALREWIPAPGLPLDLRLVVLPEAASIVRAWGCGAWATDSFASGDARIVSSEAGLRVVFVDADVWDQWRHAFAVVNRGQVSLATAGRSEMPSGEALARLRSQMATVKRTPASGGRWQITLPEVEGAHGDVAVAFARALWLAKAGDPEPPAVMEPRHSGRSEYSCEVESLSDM